MSKEQIGTESAWGWELKVMADILFCWEEFLSKCVVGGLENCEFKT